MSIVEAVVPLLMLADSTKEFTVIVSPPAANVCAEVMLAFCALPLLLPVNDPVVLYVV